MGALSQVFCLPKYQNLVSNPYQWGSSACCTLETLYHRQCSPFLHIWGQGLSRVVFCSGLLHHRLRYRCSRVTKVPNLHQLKAITSKSLVTSRSEFIHGAHWVCFASEIQLTRTGCHLTDFSLPSFSLAVHATHLWGGGVAEAYPGDVSLSAGHRARRPGGPVAPAAILLDCGRNGPAVKFITPSNIH